MSVTFSDSKPRRLSVQDGDDENAAVDETVDEEEPQNGEARQSSASGSSDSQVLIKSTDMPDHLQQAAVAVALEAIAKFEADGLKSGIHNFMAKHIKKSFDANYLGVWHCVVGRNFGSFVVHESRSFIYFYVGQIAVLLFKSGA